MAASERDMRALRGKRIGMVLQEPKYSLNQVMTVGVQLTDGPQTGAVQTPGTPNTGTPAQ